MKKNHQILAIVNLVVLVALVTWNYYSNTGAINGKTIGDVSDSYDNLFTPASYAFAIWGLIFLALLVNGIYIVYCAFSNMEETGFIANSAPWLIAANILNMAWVWLWISEHTAVSVLVMIGILLLLITAIVKLRMEIWDAPLKTIFFIWWPIDLYAGWISVATVANISAYLGSKGFSWGMSEVSWTIIMIIVIVIINAWIVKYRNMREFAMVAVWALIAIAVRHWDKIPSIQWSATIAAATLLIIVSVHGYKNRHASILTKLK